MICFVYGTLMAEQVLARVIYGRKDLHGMDVKYGSGTLAGYKRHKLQGRDYPGIVADSGAHVEGKLVYNVDQEAMKRLDYFEAEEYSREVVRVDTAEGSVDAHAYVWKHKELLLDEEWDFKDFEDNKMHKWVADELGEEEGLGGRFWSGYQSRP